MERVAVDVEAVYPMYPDESVEFCFEELRAKRRGWTDRDWTKTSQSPLRHVSGNEQRPAKQPKTESSDVENITEGLKEATIADTSSQSLVGMPQGKAAKPRRMKMREVKEETKTGESEDDFLHQSTDCDFSQNKT